MTKILVFLFIISATSIAQSAKRLQLIEEIPKTGCEDLLARTDNIGNLLAANPDKTAVIGVYGPGKNIKEYPGMFIHRALVGRWGLNVNVKIFQIQSVGPWKVRVWLSENGIANELSSAKMISRIPWSITSRYFTGGVTGDPCTNHIDRGVSLILKSNSEYIAQIIVFNVRTKKRSEVAADWIRHFQNEYGIGRKQLRVFFKNRQDSRDRTFDDMVEFWIVRAKH